MNSKARALIFPALLLTAGTAMPTAAQAMMQSFTPLPVANCGTTQANNCIQFGDFAVYSLGLLHVQDEFANTGTIPTTNPTPGDAFYVASSPGELGNDGYIVYGTGTNNNSVNTNGDGTLIDDAQSQPTGTGGSPTFVVGTATETAPTFAVDQTSSWDATLSAVRSEFAAGSDPDGQFVIYFNLNETGGKVVDPVTGLAPIDVMAWFRIVLEDVDGVLPDREFYLTGNPGSMTAPDINDVTDPNWVQVHGTICVSATAGFLGFGPCTPAQVLIGGTDVNQNLGANTAAFAMHNQELSDLVLNSGYDVMRGNWQFAELNNGYEQQFSALTPFDTPTDVPTPGSLALAGIALAALAAAMRRRREDTANRL